MQGQSPGYVISTLVTPPGSFQLAALADVKDELDVAATDTSKDAKFERLINEESQNIARYCSRIFGNAVWADEYRPQRGVWGEGVRAALNPLSLARYPLANADVVAFTGNTYTGPLAQTIDGIASTAGLATGQLLYGADIANGTTISSVANNAITISQPALAAGTAVALSTSFAVLETVGDTATWLVAGTDYEIDAGTLLPGDEGRSQIFRLNELGNPRTWPAAKIQVWYQSGYWLPNDDNYAMGDPGSLPLDLQRACIRIVVGRYRAAGRDPNLVERTQGANLGTERFWVGTTPGQSGPYPNEIMDTLNFYRVPVIG